MKPQLKDREAAGPAGIIRFYLAIFLTGLASIQMELSLLREAYFGMGATVFTNSFIISTFLGGLALGCYGANYLIEKASKDFTKSAFIVIQLLTILVVICFLFTKNYMLYLPHWILVQRGYFLIFTLAASASAGAAFSIFVKLCFERGEKYVSLVYAVGTLGNVLGGFLHGMVFVPQFGMISTYVVSIVSGGLAIVLISGLSANKNILLSILILSFSGLALAFRPLPEAMKSQLRYIEDDPYGTVNVRVKINKAGSEIRRLYIDGEFNCGNSQHSLLTVRNMTAPIVALANQGFKRALIFGYCSGQTLEPLVLKTSLEQIVSVEQNKKVLEASQKFFPETYKVTALDPRVIIKNKEFRTYLKEDAGSQKFDVVILDLGGRDLYLHGICTAEFFDLVKTRMTSHGILVIARGYMDYLRTAAEKFRFAYAMKNDFSNRGDFYLTDTPVPQDKLESLSLKEVFPLKEKGVIYTDHRIYKVKANQ